MRRIKTYKKWSIWRLTAAEAIDVGGRFAAFLPETDPGAMDEPEWAADSVQELIDLRDVNTDGWYRPEGYGGCRNCMFRGEGLPMCRRAAEAKASIPVCPFWQRREQEKGDEDGKPQEGICAAVL